MFAEPLPPGTLGLVVRILAFVLVIAAAALTPPPLRAVAPTSARENAAFSPGLGPVAPTSSQRERLESLAMFILIVGSGRVGSAVAKRALAAGHEVSVMDSDPLSHERLDKDQTTTWEDSGGRFTVGTALEIDGLIEAGIEEADIFLAATRGDNTNLVIAQIAQRRFKVPRVVVRVADPGRAAWYAEQGLLTICPTQIAIDQAERLVLAP